MSVKSKIFTIFLHSIRPFQHKLNKILFIKYIFQKLYNHFAPNEELLIEVQGQKMYVNLRDRAISRFLIQEGVYEKGTTVVVFKRILRKGMIVVDAGANIGYYSLIAASIVGSEKKVHVFEPSIYKR